MMKRLFTFVAVMLLISAISAQTVTLTFTGRDADNHYVQLDRVTVINQTKRWQETLTWPDTTLTMQNGTGIDEPAANGDFALLQNTPNPFNGVTDVNLRVADAGVVTIEIADVNGKIVGTYRLRAEIGNHQFRVTLSATGTYVMTARQNGQISSIKMVNNSTGNGNGIEYMGTVGANNYSSLPYRRLTTNLFDLGDQMEYVGSATINGETKESRHVTQAQNASETITLTFDVAQDPCPATLKDIDGNVYNTVLIGTQCWMASNLRTTHFADNTFIPSVDTVSYKDPYRHAPDNDEANVTEYGYLYNWAAAMRGAASSVTNPSGVQGICPNGWHLPSDAEWTQLTDYVSSQSEYVCGTNNINIAKALAADTGWVEYTGECCVGDNQSANNATGFGVLPAACFNMSCEYLYFGEAAYFWSSTEYSGNYAYTRFVGIGRADVYRSYRYKTMSISVRCVQN